MSTIPSFKSGGKQVCSCIAVCYTIASQNQEFHQVRLSDCCTKPNPITYCSTTEGCSREVDTADTHWCWNICSRQKGTCTRRSPGSPSHSSRSDTTEGSPRCCTWSHHRTPRHCWNYRACWFGSWQGCIVSERAGDDRISWSRTMLLGKLTPHSAMPRWHCDGLAHLRLRVLMYSDAALYSKLQLCNWMALLLWVFSVTYSVTCSAWFESSTSSLISCFSALRRTFLHLLMKQICHAQHSPGICHHHFLSHLKIMVHWTKKLFHTKLWCYTNVLFHIYTSFLRLFSPCSLHTWTACHSRAHFHACCQLHRVRNTDRYLRLGTFSAE